MASFKLLENASVNDASDTVYFQLREKEGRVNLFAVDRNGRKIDGGHLLRLDAEGLRLMDGCPSITKLDRYGRLATY